MKFNKPSPLLRELKAILVDNSFEKKRKIMQASNFFRTKMVKEKTKKAENYLEAAADLQGLVTQLLNKDLYDLAAYLLWPQHQFNLESNFTKKIWSKLSQSSRVMILGCGASGKSYSVAGFNFLDWLRLPNWTMIKCVSFTGEHAKRNVFAHMKNFHETALIPLPGMRMETSIKSTDNPAMGIHLVCVKQGEGGEAALHGFHPPPMPTEHPKYGTTSRCILLLDEAEEIPDGVWEGVQNVALTMQGNNDLHVKICAMTNPKRIYSRMADLAEPEKGWESVDIETEEWTSKERWEVIRLDGAKCENVISGKNICKGLITREGYNFYLAKGENNPEYLTMARGFYPQEGADCNVISPALIEKSKGVFEISNPEYFAAIDVALEGRDRAILTLGRMGLSRGYKKPTDEFITFEKQKFVIQIEMSAELQKTPENPTVGLVDQIVQYANIYRIKTEHIGIDCTGNGAGVRDILSQRLGSNVIGISWGGNATDLPIIGDTTTPAKEIYDSLPTEMYFAARIFMENDSLKFSSFFVDDDLFRELSSATYKQVRAGKIRLNPKKETKGILGLSPDKADSFVMAIHVARLSKRQSIFIQNDYKPEEKYKIPSSQFDHRQFTDLSSW